MSESYYGNEEYWIFKGRIKDEFAYLAKKISDDETFLIEDILFEVIRDLLALKRKRLNHSMMMVIDRALTPVCRSLRDDEMYRTYISSIIQRIEMAQL